MVVIMKGRAIIILCASAFALAARPRDANANNACAAPNSEGLLVPHENCNRFYKCNGGHPVSQDCPAGLLYNIEAEVCDWPENVNCGERTIAELANESIGNGNGVWVPQRGNSDPSQAQAICRSPGSDGVLVAHETCSKFYKCYRGEPVAIDCPAPLLYHPEIEVCDWPENVDCNGRVN